MMYFVFVLPCETKFVSLVSRFGIYSETEGLLNLVICLQSPKGTFSTVQMILMHTKIENHCMKSFCISPFPVYVALVRLFY